MLSTSDLTAIARARLRDAKVLLAKKRHDGAVYLCGYAVEIALKSRITKTLKWTQGFPEKANEFTGLQSFKVRDLDALLKLSGWEAKIRWRRSADWSRLGQWDPELRYAMPGKATPLEAAEMIASATEIVRALL